MLIRLASKLQRNSIVDGEGIRAVVWTQGCPHNCPNCHNPETHDYNGGFLIDVEELKEEVNVHIEIGTGMGRTGIQSKNIDEYIQKLKQYKLHIE